MRKKLFAMLLALTLTCSCLTACGDSSQSDSNSSSTTSKSDAKLDETGSCGEQGDNIKYELYSDGSLIISGSGKMKKYAHPEYLEGTEKASPFYQKSSWIKSITISEGITNVSDYAFFNCNNVASVKIGGSVTEIGEQAFAYCTSISEITIPSNVKCIQALAFLECSNLSELTIENGVEEIGSGAFRDDPKLTSVKIPESVTTFGTFAFAYHKTDTKTPGFSITGKAGSNAEKYCQEENLEFKSE